MQILLGDRELGQPGLGDPVEGFQAGAFLALLDHLPPAKVLGVLLEGGQLREGVVAHQKLTQRLPSGGVQPLGEQVAQAPPLGGQRLTDQCLQRRIAGPYDALCVERGDELGDEESGSGIPADHLGELLRKGREELGRPEPIHEQLRD